MFNEAQHAAAHDFSLLVDARVEEGWGIVNAGDTCYYLLEKGVFQMSVGVDEAARIVVTHLRVA
jgi:hypothetical protein